MLAVELRFLTGQYHATPWGRNVNEGVAEWPPSPFRLARAVIDAHRRRHPDEPEDKLLDSLAALEQPVEFIVPRSTQSHVRLFLHQNEQDPSKKQKIFDTFVIIEPQEPVVMLFQAATDRTMLAYLDTLLRDLSYLGRSESWVSARLLDSVPTTSGDQIRYVRDSVADTSGLASTVRLACLRPRDSYEQLSPKPAVRSKSRRKTPARTLSWIEAVSMSTKDLHAGGWSAHPAQIPIPFRCQDTAPSVRKSGPTGQLEGLFHEARFALHGSVLPRVIDTVAFTERVRRKLMGIHKAVMGGEPSLVSRTFSGKSETGAKARGHRHAYYLALDEDHYGRIDHLIVRSSEAFDATELQALDGLRSIWQRKGRPDVLFVLEGLYRSPREVASTRWVSATPFVTRRNYRKGRGDFEQWVNGEIRRACLQHGIPEPLSLDAIPHTSHDGHPYRWMEFLRSRKGQHAPRGHGRILTFDEPVSGPFSIGDLAHFGLGLFEPLQDKRR